MVTADTHHLLWSIKPPSHPHTSIQRAVRAAEPLDRVPTVNHGGVDVPCTASPPLHYTRLHMCPLAGSSRVDQPAKVSTNHEPGTSNSASRFPVKEHRHDGQVSNLHFPFTP